MQKLSIQYDIPEQYDIPDRLTYAKGIYGGRSYEYGAGGRMIKKGSYTMLYNGT